MEYRPSFVSLDIGIECLECGNTRERGAWDGDNRFFCVMCWRSYLNFPSPEEAFRVENLTHLDPSSVKADWKDCLLEGVKPTIVKDLECAICFEPMVDPVILSCGHGFHQGCIRTLTQCPLDRKTISPSHPRTPSTWVKNLLGNIKCYCIFSKRVGSADYSCPEIRDITDMENHIAQCDYAPSTCQFCNKMYTKKDIKLHEMVCTEKPVVCGFPNCKFSSTQAQMRDHVTTCKNAISLCFGHPAGCDAIIGRKDKRDHEEKCPYVTIEKQRIQIKELSDEIEKFRSKYPPVELASPDPEISSEVGFETRRKIAVAYNNAPQNGMSKEEFLQKFKDMHSITLTKIIVENWVNVYLGKVTEI